MSDRTTSRRDFIKTIAVGSSLACASGSLALLSGCSSKIDSNQSYLYNVIKPQNISTVDIWTDVMLQAARNKSFTPPPATRAYAMGHLAGFLAVNGIEDAYNTPYNLGEGPKNADPDVAYGVAVSYAISDAFQALFTFDRHRFLERFPNSEAKAEGIRWGKRVADYVIKKRTRDGAEPSKSAYYLGRYPRKEGIMAWSPTGPFYGADYGPPFKTFGRGLLPGWGSVDPWVMKDTKVFRAEPFPDPQSKEFARQFMEVKELGAYNSKTRTADQMQIAFFWEDGPRAITPAGAYIPIALDIMQDMNFSLLEKARNLALLSLGNADAAITTWDSKYAYDIVRPETMIRHRVHKLGNPAIAGERDSKWTSLIPTPNFPAYTSGHSCFSGVSARMIALCVGRDDVKFSRTSTDMVNWPAYLRNVTRSFTSLWQAAEENAASRIYGGVHWHADNSEGLRIGKELADYIYQNAFIRKV